MMEGMATMMTNVTSTVIQSTASITSVTMNNTMSMNEDLVWYENKLFPISNHLNEMNLIFFFKKMIK